MRSYGGRVEAVEGSVDKDAMQELAEDMISIIASFCARLYGLRSRKLQKIKEVIMGEVHGEG